MKLRLILLPSLFAALASAGPSFTLLAPGPDLFGTAGSTVTWIFRIQNDADFLLPLQVDYLTLNSVGTFTDLFSATAPFLGPGDSADGSASYAIDPPAPPTTSSGIIELTYNLYNLDPNDPSFDPDANLIASFQTLDADQPVSVTVTSPGVPEPASWTLAVPGVAVLWLYVRRRARPAAIP
jgi:hypothetical protein